MMLYEQYNVIVISVVLIKAINNQNTVLLFVHVFIHYKYRDNDCGGYEPYRTKFERKACPIAQKKKN